MGIDFFCDKPFDIGNRHCNIISFMNKWKSVWNKKGSTTENVTLETLIKTDGFDGHTGNLNIRDWLNFVNKIAVIIGLQSGDSIFEAGCGSGAFLYPFFLQSHQVGGIDYAPRLIEIASSAMPSMQFEVREAAKLPLLPKFDIVISNSVFHYFRDREYAEKVVDKMIQKAIRKVAILDINDKSKEHTALKTRREAYPPGEYDKKYKGLNQLFYEKDWFIQMAEKQKLGIEIFDQDIEGYQNSSYRFNVIMTKL